MKVGTDGVLLGAWTELPSSETCSGNGKAERVSLLDVGCGCGLIALMLAQRAAAAGLSDKVLIRAVDLHPGSVADARENFAASPWHSHLDVFQDDFLHFAPACPAGSFSLLVSNPPFFSQSLKSASDRRNLARHNDTLPFPALLREAERLLAPGGSLAMVLPVPAYGEMEALIPACAPSLRLSRLTEVYSREGKPCERMLAQWERVRESAEGNVPAAETEIRRDSLRILCADGGYAAEYRERVRDFYLWA